MAIKRGTQFKVKAVWPGCGQVGIKVGTVLTHEAPERGCPGMHRMRIGTHPALGRLVHVYDRQVEEKLVPVRSR